MWSQLAEPLLNNTFDSNMAGVGAGIYWYSRDPPNAGACNDCSYRANTVTFYGPNRATDVATVRTQVASTQRRSVMFPFYGNLPLDPVPTTPDIKPLGLALYDAFDQRVNDDFNGKGVQCRAWPSLPSIIHGHLTVIKGEIVQFSDYGEVEYPDLILAGVPGSQYTIDFDCKWERCLANELGMLQFGATTSAQLDALYCAPGMATSYDKFSRGMCRWCKALTYSLEENSTQCLKCPDGATCDGRTKIVPNEGYWSTVEWGFKHLDQVYECPIPDGCHGGENASYWVLNSSYTGENSTCAEGYTGLVCGMCVEGYANVAGCIKCGTWKIWVPMMSMLVLAIIAGIVAFVVYKVVTRANEAEEAAKADAAEEAAKADAAGGGNEAEANVEGIDDADGIHIEMDTIMEGKQPGSGITTSTSEVGKGAGAGADAGGGDVEDIDDVYADAQGEIEDALRDAVDTGIADGFIDSAAAGGANIDFGALQDTINDVVNALKDALKEVQEKLSEIGKIMIGYLQMLTNFIVVLPNIPWGEMFAFFSMIFSPVNFDINRMLPLACYVEVTGYNLFIGHLLLPVITAILCLSSVGVLKARLNLHRIHTFRCRVRSHWSGSKLYCE